MACASRIPDDIPGLMFDKFEAFESNTKQIKQMISRAVKQQKGRTGPSIEGESSKSKFSETESFSLELTVKQLVPSYPGRQVIYSLSTGTCSSVAHRCRRSCKRPPSSGARRSIQSALHSTKQVDLFGLTYSSKELMVIKYLKD